jgi:hypothetical protein
MLKTSAGKVVISGWFLIFFFFIQVNLYAANVTVPSLELYTKGAWEDNIFALRTAGEMDLRVEGGYKFGGRVVLGFDSTNLEENFIDRESSSIAGFTFQTASIVIREMFSLPLAFTFFIGESDIFASGEGFDYIFGDKNVKANYSGFLYFFDGIRYDGIYQPAGTGIKFEIGPLHEFFYMSLYAYQDGYFYLDNPTDKTFSPGQYSGDLRMLFNFDRIKLEAFVGGTAPVPDSLYGYYRAGLLFQAQALKGLELIAQVGLPLWNPATSFDINLFYMLLEFKLFPGVVKLIPTVFLHPKYYKQQPTDEEYQLDVNLKLHIGTDESLINGGVEVNSQLDIEELLNKTEVRVAPYLSFITPGVVWQLKVNAKVYPFNFEEMFEGFIGIKAEF